MPHPHRLPRPQASRKPAAPRAFIRNQASPIAAPSGSEPEQPGNPWTLFDQYQAALRRLAQSDALTSGDLPLAGQAITESCGALINVARTSLWLFEHDRQTMTLLDRYDADAHSHQRSGR